MPVLKRRQPTLSLLDTIVATVGDRPVRFEELTAAIEREGHGKVGLWLVKAAVQSLADGHVISKTDQGFISTRRFA